MKEIRCSQCRNITQWENNPYRPFCSERCKLIDLGEWIEGTYSIAGASIPLPEEENTSIAEHEETS